MRGVTSTTTTKASRLKYWRQQVGRSWYLWMIVAALLLAVQNLQQTLLAPHHRLGHHLLQQSSYSSISTSWLSLADTAPRITIAIAVTVTGCSKIPLDGAAVLQHSIRKLASRSRYKYHFYAIYHPTASECAQPLAAIGYTLLERETPVNMSEIEGAEYRDILPRSGCCGEKELLKFEALRLTQHPVVVMLDMDMIFANPLDDLFDLMLFHKRPVEDHHFMWPQQELPSDIWLFYVNDYTITGPEIEVKPTQGGFAVFKPNLTIYQEIMGIVKKGNFSGAYGWHPKSDFFYGSPTFQGLTPFYFQIVQPGHAVELNWCRHNSGNTPPRNAKGQCFSNQTVCEDCRDRQLSEVYAYHFLFCGKPWQCDGDEERKQPKHEICHQSHQAWFDLRADLLKSWGRLDNETNPATRSYDPTKEPLGFCHPLGLWGHYQPIRQPFGVP